VTAPEVLTIVVLGAVVAAAILGIGRALFAVVADEEWARVAGLPVGLMNDLLALTTAVTVVASMRVVGVLLVAGLMVLPVASAQLLARSFLGTMIWASSIGVGSVVVGLVTSRLWNLASGGMIVLVAAITYAVVAIATTGRSRGHILSGRKPGNRTHPPGRTGVILDDSH
jgi:zinc transport system permease protein